MLRVVLVFCLLLLHALPVFAQDEINEITIQVDSLKDVHDTLTLQLEHVEQELADLEALLQEHTVKEQIHARGVVTTNMDASLRDEPMPGANIIRTIPQNKVLEALAYNGAYWKVRYKNTEGWVMRLFVDEGEGADLIKEESASLAAIGQEDMDEQKELWMQERAGKTFLITALDLLANSAGGISIQYAFEHLDSTRTVQEVVFSITPYNSSGVIERGRNSGASTRRLRRFGPVSVYDGEQRFQFENIWYNEKIECVQLDRIDISYADGTRNSFYKDIENLLASNVDNNCSITAAERMEGEKGSVP